jgi:hypothetical protein
MYQKTKGKTKQSRNGSIVPVHTHNNEEYYLFALFTSGKLEIYFQWMLKRQVFMNEEKRIELMKRLNTIPGVSLPKESITKRPSIKLAVLSDGDNVKRFLDIYAWYLQEVEQL